MIKKAKKETSEQERSPLDPIDFPELVIGLVGPAGSDLGLVIDKLKDELGKVDYDVEEIRLSKLIESFLGKNYDETPEYDRIDHLMDDGTEIRESSTRGDAIALLSIAEIRALRAKRQQDKKSPKVVYILRSLKHPHEIETLKNIYGSGYFTISAYSPREARVDALAERITKSNHTGASNSRSEAEKLIEKDESERGKDLGQDVKDAFPLADLFVDCRSKAILKKNTKRFVELLFAYPYHTPTKDEYGMFHAKSAALRSADLGRQVGAVIATKESDIIAVGCNDVPNDEVDERDFQVGKDSMYEQRENILSEIIEKFKSDKMLTDKLNSESTRVIVNSLINGKKKAVLKGAQVMNLLEFGRSVHAEMAALMDAARRGVSVKGATLYCTTFPCHLCARHIIAAGIDRVVYIEPYPKSRAKQLHKDSITVDAKDKTSKKINFESFTGIAPRKFLDMFEMNGIRKDETGRIIDWAGNIKKPRVIRFKNTYIDIETAIVGEVLPEIIAAMGLSASMFPNSAKGE